MALLLVVPDRDMNRLVAEIHTQAPDLDVRIWPRTGPPEDIRFAVLWQQPKDLLRQLPNLEAVTSLGAGVEHILEDPQLPPTLPVGRLAGKRMAADMAGYLVAQVLGHWRDLDQFARQQARRQWAPWAPSGPPKVGLIGTGQMAAGALRSFQALDVQVKAFNRTGKPVPGMTVVTGRDGLFELAGWSDYLICLLPLTARTRGILNADLFDHMPSHAVLINVGRGEHLVEKDLLAALDGGCPGGAILDVFTHEPLPPDHPFWTHPKIKITPHCASITSDSEAAHLIIQSYQRVISGLGPLAPVERALGY